MDVLKYTNIIIQFVPPVLVEDGEPAADSSYFVEIKSPHSNRPGVFQALPQKIVLPLPENEPLRLKLLPSDFYLPVGRYQVRYYQRGKSDCIHYEEWTVPTYPNRVSRTYVVTEDERVPLPDDYFSSMELDWTGPWELAYNAIVFRSLNPGVGTKLTLDYEAGVTRERLVDMSRTHPQHL